MYTQILNFIIQPILGGAAGYITNEYAINMLFKTYTPLKIGGVIPKTRKEFISNITKLIEEDIINKDKLSEILCDEKFICNFNMLADDFYNKFLYTTTNNMTIEQIPGFNDFNKSIEQLINKYMPEIISNLSVYINSKENLTEYFTKEILPSLTDSIFNEILNIIKYSNRSINIASILKESNSNITINQIIDKNIANKIISNISKLIEEKIKNDTQINSYIDNFLDKSATSLNIGHHISETLSDTIRSRYKDIKSFLIKMQQKSTDSEEFVELIKNIIALMIKYGKTLDIPVIDLIQDKSLSGIRKIIGSNTSNVLKLISNFIEENEINIKQLVKDSANEVIDEQDGTKKAMLSMARGTINNKIDEFNIKTAFMNIAQNENNIENLSLTVVLYIKKILSTVTVSQLIDILENKNIMTVESFSSFIIQLINNPESGLPEKIIQIFENIVSSNKFKEIAQMQTIKIIKNKIIFSNNLSNYISGLLTNKIDSLANIDIKTAISNLIYANKDKATSSICSYIKNDFDLNKIIKENTDGITENTKCLYTKFIKKYKKLSVHELLNKVNSIEDLHQNTAEGIRKYLNDNLSKTLYKFVHGLSESNLEKLNDDELCEMAKSFIGNNLKPIMYFGGMLGVIAGLLLAIFNGNTDIFGTISPAGALTYSAVGFLTNAIAINMLFRPYKEIKLIKNIPFFRHFSLGYIAKNKLSMANSFAYSIDKYLLSDNSISELFTKYETTIKENINNLLKANEYEKVNEYFKRNINNMSLFIADRGISSIKCNQNKISSFITGKTGNISLTNLYSKNIDNISKYIVENKNTIMQYISKELNTIVNSEKQLKDIISTDEFSNKLANDLTGGFRNSFDKIFNKDLTNSVKNKWIDNLANYISTLIVNCTHKSNGNENTEYSDTISNIIIDNLSNNNEINTQIKNVIVNKINQAMQNDNKICDILDGKINDFAESYINNILSDINAKSKKLMTKLKPRASEFVQNQITAKLNFFTKGMYNMAGGPQLVDSITNKFMTEKLPNYLQSNPDGIKVLMFGISKLLLDTQISSLNLTLDDAYQYTVATACSQRLDKKAEQKTDEKILQEITNNTWQDVSNKTEQETANKAEQDEIKSEIYKNLINMIQLFSRNVCASDIIDIFGVENIDELQNNLKVYISNFVEAIANENLSNDNISKENLFDMLRDTLSQITDILLDNTTVKEIFMSINTNDINNLSDEITNIFINDEFVKKALLKIDKYLYEQKNLLYINDLADMTNINDSLRTYIENISEDKMFYDIYVSQVNSLLQSLENDNFISENNELMQYLIETITDAGIMSIKNNANKILKDIKFDNLVQEQLINMDNKKIHKMFNSFAGKYFKSLMVYGVFGAVFGLNTVAGLAFASIYGIKNIAENKKISKIKKK